MTNQQKATALYLYTCVGMGVVSQSRQDIVGILNYDQSDAQIIYEYLNSVGVVTQAPHKRGRGRDYGCFKGHGLTESDMLNFVASGSRDIHAFFGGNRAAAQPRRQQISRPQPRPVPQTPVYEEEDDDFNAYENTHNSRYDGRQNNNISLSDLSGRELLVMLIAGAFVLALLWFAVKFIWNLAGSILSGVFFFLRSINYVKLISLLGAVLVTKPILTAKNSGFNLGGRIMILFVIWISVLYYIGNM